MAMTEADKLNNLKLLTSDVACTDEKLLFYLSMAEYKILERCYPSVDLSETLSDGSLRFKMPTRYERLQVELASRYVFRQGFEGQTSSNESGILRVYGSTNDEDLLKEVMQRIVVR